MDKRVCLIIEAINKDLREEICLENLAHSINLSPSRLRHLFKEETGVTLRQYQAKLRMEKAKHLIETSFLSIKEVRAKIGIFDKGYFNREFKRQYGYSPSQYRKEVLIDGRNTVELR